MLPSLPPWAYALVAVVVTVFLQEIRTRRRRRHLPPGPPGLPLIGNMFNVPTKHLGHEFHEMSQKYGDLVYLEALGKPMLVVGSHKVARELIDKRSNNYSDRPRSIMIGLVGMDLQMTLAPYGNRWKLHRRLFNQSFKADMIDRYEPLQLVAAHGLLENILRSPNQLAAHVKLCFSSLLMNVAYGVEANDNSFNLIERMNAVGEKISVPGRYAVEAIPSLLYLPSWFPGAGFKAYAAKSKVFYDACLDKLYKDSVDALRAGVGKPSLVSKFIEEPGSVDLENGEDLDSVVKVLTITTYNAGVDTTYNSLQAFFLAMAMYPEVQKKAHEELDRVIGSGRLPEFEDRKSLPYLTAILKEVLRWHVVTPIGLPHAVVADDTYNGYHIPGGATISVNIWALARDPEVYPDPDNFIPERFLDAQGNLDTSKGDPSDVVFGFGRRVCPGRYFAESSLFIFAAAFLHAFNVSPPLDAQGKPMKLHHNMMTAGIVAHPDLYEYVIKPRSARAEQLVAEGWHSA